MSMLELKRQAKSLIDDLKPEDLKLVREFLVFVATRDRRRSDLNEETRELLAIPGFQKSFLRGVNDLKAGRGKPWRQVRKDV